MNKYRRRRSIARFLSSRERKGFVCKTKRTFATRDEAVTCQPAQTAYRCRTCGQWHLTSKKERGLMKTTLLCFISAYSVGIVIAIALTCACKPRVRADDIWRGTPGPLVCSYSNRDDQYTCIGYGRVYLCIRAVKHGAVSFDCAPYVPSPIEAP